MIFASMTLNRYFDRVVCINLDSRPDRWAEVCSEFKRHRIEVERYAAINGTAHESEGGQLSPAERGCLESHLAVIRSSVERDCQRTLIFEDDVEFDPDLQNLFHQALEADWIPPGWDFLYLGGAHVEPPQRINPRIARVLRTHTTSHYAISGRFAHQLIQSNPSLHEPIDVLLTRYQKVKRSYTFEPAIAWQRSGYSDIRRKHVDYSRFMKPPYGKRGEAT